MVFLNNHAVMEGCIPIGGLWPVGYIGVGARAPYPKTMRENYAEQDEHTIEAIAAARKLSIQIVLVVKILKSGGAINRELLRGQGGFDLFLRRLEDA